MIDAGERRLPTGPRGQGWIRQSRAVLPVVEGLAGTQGVAGGELRGGRRFGSNWGLVLRWFLVEAEGLGGSARSRGRGWWHWRDGRGSACDEWHRSMAAAELIGDEEEGFPPSISGRGGFRGTA